MSEKTRKPARVVISFDTHTPYLAFRVTSIMRALEERGLGKSTEVHVVLLGAQEPGYEWENGDLDVRYGGARVHVLLEKFHGLGLRSSLSRKALVTVWRFVKKLVVLRPKVVFVGGYDRPASFVGAILSSTMRFKIGVLWDSRFNDAESFPKNLALERVKAFMVRRYDFFMCSGRECVEYTRFLAGRNKPVWSRAWDVVDNESIARLAEEAGADEEIYAHLSIPAGAPFFLAPNRFVPKKNASGLLRAIALYREKAMAAGHEAVHFILSGKGPLREAIEAEVREGGLEDCVRIVDWIPYHRMPRAFRLSLGLVLPSHFDQWGMTVNEALAAGAPALVSNRCGAHELVRNHVNGYTFDPDDAGHLSELLLSVGHERGLCERLRGQAVETMKGFSIRQYCDAHLEALEHYGAIERRRPSGRASVRAGRAGRPDSEPSGFAGGEHR